MVTDVNQLADQIVQRMKDEHHTMWLDPETHSAQHEFIMILMSEREERMKRRKAIEDKIAGSLIVSALLAIIAFTGAGAMDWLRAHLK